MSQAEARLSLRRWCFGISPAETTFSRRGFRESDPQARRRLERVGEIFLHGYHCALEEAELPSLAGRLEQLEAEVRGFGFEGAAMALALLDQLAPWRRGRFAAFVAGPGAAHVYMAHVGAGWAMARLPWRRRRVQRSLRDLDPLLRWLAVDGYGFHEGYFDWRRSVERQAQPPGLTGYAGHAFDQGLGRSLWFIEGADGERVAARVGAFPTARRPDLWSGAGLACAYAGGTTPEAVERLRAAAGPCRPCLAQGAAFAAQARQRAGNPSPSTELACEVFCGCTAAEAAAATQTDLEGLPSGGIEPAYETWRQRLQARFAREEVPR
jgi:hypothetical protein